MDSWNERTEVYVVDLMNKSIKEILSEKHWATKCILIYRFHSDMLDKYGNQRGLGWTILDTAAKLDFSTGYISESIQLAKGIEKYGEDLKVLSRENALLALRNNKK